MANLFLIIGIGAGFILLERFRPDRSLPKVKGWWFRVALVNLLQLGIVILGGFTWDLYFRRFSFMDLSHLNPALAGLLAYLASTFVFYWWHRLRHSSKFFWLSCHQIHHSPSRLETITSFYKHPVEITANSLLTGFIVYVCLGVGVEGAAWNLLFSAVGEYFYHMNVRTPRWVGFFMQRPEMHKIHHEKGSHYYNFADLPVWDMLFGTYKNPRDFQADCGFEEERESKIFSMLLFQDVNKTQPGEGRI